MHFSPYVWKPGRLEKCVKCQPQMAYFPVVLLLKSLFFEVCIIHEIEKCTVLGLSGKIIKAISILWELWPNLHFCDCNNNYLNLRVWQLCAATVLTAWSSRRQAPPLLHWGGTQTSAEDACIFEWRRYILESVKRCSDPYWISPDWSLISLTKQTT